MKFTIKKQYLVEVVNKMHEVASKGIKNDFKFANRLQIEALDNSIIIKAANGHLFAQYNIPDNVKVAEKGSVIVDSAIAKEIIKSIGCSSAIDHDIEIETIDNGFRLRDISSKGRKWSKMQTLSESHAIDVKDIKKCSMYSLPVADFCHPVKTLSKYKTVFEHDIHLTLICFHFLCDKTRYICGDGSFFGVWETRRAAQFDSLKNPEGDKWAIPANQAAIITSVVSDEKEITMKFPDVKNCYIYAGNNIKMHLKGIPEGEYIMYEKHAFRFDEAKAVIDVKRQDFLDAINSVLAVRDKEGEKESTFHSCKFEVRADEMILSVPKGKYSCEFQFPATYYKIKDDSFSSEYSWAFLNNVAIASNCEYIRFYTIDADGVILAEQLNLTDTEKDERVKVDCPASRDKDTQLTFFFADASNDSEDN